MPICDLPGSSLVQLGGEVKNPAECPVPSLQSQLFVSQGGNQPDGPEEDEQSKGWGYFSLSQGQ